MKRKKIIKGLKDKFRITPEIQNHLNLLKEHYNKINKPIKDIDNEIIILRQKGLSRKEICNELNINIKQLEYRITKINKENNMKMDQSAEEQAHIIIENYIEGIIAWCQVIVDAVKKENYEYAQTIKEIVDENLRLTAEDLFQITDLSLPTIVKYLDEQRNYIIEKLMENDR